MNGSPGLHVLLLHSGFWLHVFSGLCSLLFWQGLQLFEPRQGRGKKTSKGTPAVTKEASARISTVLGTRTFGPRPAGSKPFCVSFYLQILCKVLISLNLSYYV